MTRQELSLLLYCEARAVDYSGRMNDAQMNDEERLKLDQWNGTGFVRSGRIVAKDHNNDGTLWVWLSDAAFEAAQTERRARAARCWSSRRFTTTAEKRGETAPQYEPRNAGTA